MTAADLAMGRAEFAESDLSSDERALNGEALLATGEAFEREECWLFFHLDCARRARMRMDAMPGWDLEYVHEYRARELALAGAARHYSRLQAAGGQITALLAEMVLAEGLTP